MVVIPQSSQEIVPNLYEGEDPPSILKVEQGRLKKTANSDKTLLETLLKQSHRSRRKAKSIPTRKNKRNYQRLLHAIEELKKSINRKELERKELDKILKEN